MNHTGYQSYQRNATLGGWTRIDALLAIYDRAIASTRAAQEAHRAGQPVHSAEKSCNAHQCILALHTGLKPEECSIARNVERLLLFAITCLGEKRFEEAADVLESLRSGFEAIREEATRLEKEGVIPPLDAAVEVVATA